MNSDREESSKAALTTAWIKLIHSLTHELRTPIAGIGLCGAVMAEIFPELLKGYHLAINQGLMEATLNERRLKNLEANGFSGIAEDVKTLFHRLGFLDDCAKALDANLLEIETYPIQYYIDRLLKNYPFENEIEKNKVNLNIQHDFTVQCAPIFIEALLNNLLENALRSIQEAKKR